MTNSQSIDEALQAKASALLHELGLWQDSIHPMPLHQHLLDAAIAIVKAFLAQPLIAGGVEGWKMDKLAEAIEGSVIANWSGDMGDGYGGFNAMKVASEVIEKLSASPAAPATEGVPWAEVTGVCQTVGSGEFRSITILNKDTGSLKMFVPAETSPAAAPESVVDDLAKRLRDLWSKYWAEALDSDEVEATLEEAAARITEMKEALTPFAEMAEQVERWKTSTGNFEGSFDAGDLRRAARALSQMKP